MKTKKILVISALVLAVNLLNCALILAEEEAGQDKITWDDLAGVGLSAPDDPAPAIPAPTVTSIPSQPVKETVKEEKTTQKVARKNQSVKRTAKKKVAPSVDYVEEEEPESFRQAIAMTETDPVLNRDITIINPDSE